MWKNNCRFSDFDFFLNSKTKVPLKGSAMIFFTISKSFFSLTLTIKPPWSLNWKSFFHNFFFFLNAVMFLLFCCYGLPMSSGLCRHWFIIVGLPLNTGVLVLIFLKINNKRALKHALFQEKSNIGEIHGLSTQKWGRERKGKIRSTLSFTNLDTVSSKMGTK